MQEIMETIKENIKRLRWEKAKVDYDLSFWECQLRFLEDLKEPKGSEKENVVR